MIYVGRHNSQVVSRRNFRDVPVRLRKSVAGWAAWVRGGAGRPAGLERAGGPAVEGKDEARGHVIPGVGAEGLGESREGSGPAVGVGLPGTESLGEVGGVVGVGDEEVAEVVRVALGNAGGGGNEGGQAAAERLLRHERVSLVARG